MPLDVVPSVCPHDCPSACALEIERIDGRRIGRVRGAGAQSYTRGIVCAKVARYAERQHHPERLSQPLQRVGEKGVGGLQRRVVIVEGLDLSSAPSGECELLCLPLLIADGDGAPARVFIRVPG